MFDPKNLRDLWAAVMDQAIDDITDPDGSKPQIKAPCRRRAMAWVKAKSTEMQSFIGICWSLGLDPDDTRTRILSKPRVPIT